MDGATFWTMRKTSCMEPCCADDALDAEAALELLAEDAVLVDQTAALQGTPHDEQEDLLVEGLGEVVEGPLAHGLDGAVDGAVGRHDDDTGRGGPLRQIREQRDAVAVGHLEVGEDDVEGARSAEVVEGLACAARRHGLVALGPQDELEDLALVALVVDDRAAGPSRGHHRLG